MALEQYIEVLEKPSFKIEVDTSELLGLLKELRDARELIKHQAQYIECHIEKGNCDLCKYRNGRCKTGGECSDS